MTNPTTYSCQIVRTSRANAIGIDSEHDRPAEVAGDQDRAAPQPVDPGAGRQAEQDERQELDRAEQGDLERRRLSSVTATSGSASRLTCVPNWLIVSAVQSLTKSAVAQARLASDRRRSRGGQSTALDTVYALFVTAVRVGAPVAVGLASSAC